MAVKKCSMSVNIVWHLPQVGSSQIHGPVARGHPTMMSALHRDWEGDGEVIEWDRAEAERRVDQG